MSDVALAPRIQALLSADDSPPRAELTRMALEALLSQPMASLLADPELVPIMLSAFTPGNAERVAERHGVPATTRIGVRLEACEERLRDMLPEASREGLVRILASGKGPRLGWLKGALDPTDLRELFAPVIQQMLVQFSSRLQIPGFGATGAVAGPAAGALSGLVGMLGKQVQKGASQFAEVGKNVMGGLGSELERRLQALARDFSHTAMGEFRTAMEERLRSAEGQVILDRMRDRALTHVFEAKLADIARDLLQLPMQDLAAWSPAVVAYQSAHPLLTGMLETELGAALTVLGQRSLSELLSEAGLLEAASELTLRVVDPGAKALFASAAFGDWLSRLVDAAREP